MELSEAQEAILRHLYQNGDDVPANISEATGYHRNSIVRAVRPVENEGLVENKGHGVYRLTEAGRQTARELV